MQFLMYMTREYCVTIDEKNPTLIFKYDEIYAINSFLSSVSTNMLIYFNTADTVFSSLLPYQNHCYAIS